MAVLRRVEERLVEGQHEREERQRELILLARREEEEAREEGERRRRCKEQTSRLAPLHTRIKGRVQALLTFWTHQQDKTVFSEEVTTGVPAVLSQCNVLLKEAREEVGEGRAEEGLWGRLASLEQSLGGILAKVELDMAAKLAREEEEARRAAAAPPAAIPPPAAPLVAPVAPVAPVATTSAPLPASSADNEGWYASVKKFKEDYVKDVKFEDKDKPYKFNLQKAVNTPLNSLSGVSPTHLQDKVDKLVSLLSGETVTVVDRQLSVASHPHARKFCMALAAKKIAKQGEEVVSSDPKSAFPAATLAVALWDRFPEFGFLLLAYLFECCPFLVPVHPQRTEGESDKQWYERLGYKYEGGEVEKQDKYLKRLSGVARLYSALSVVHLPKASPNTTHPHSLQRLWSWLASLTSLSPHTDVSASLLLQVLEVGGSSLCARYGRQLGKLLQLLLQQYLPLMESD